MRGTTKILARDIVGLDYFSREGPLARNIKGLARDRSVLLSVTGTGMPVTGGGTI
jgi:hypothetical protein